MNVVIITGASSGIGREFAIQMDETLQNIDEYWLIARRKDRLDEVAASMKTKTRIIPLDIIEKRSLEVLYYVLKEEAPKIRFLVNGAGFGILGNFDESNLTEQTDMIHLNCTALTQITRMCLPYMKRNSRIIQMASSASFLPQANFAIYAATKAFVLSFSQGLGQELKKRGIYVTAVCPGPVETEFFTIAEKHGSIMKIKKLFMVQAKDVVRCAMRDSIRKKDISIYGMPMKSLYIIAKFAPKKLIYAILSFVK